MSDTIFHIMTGGTIGGCVPEYPEIMKLADIFRDPIDFSKYIELSFKLRATYQDQKVCHKDSRDITDADRAYIGEVIVEQYKKGVRKFLITHGTYTMPETGTYLINHLPVDVAKGTTIIITGSIFPWNVIGSDAPMNLGAALAILVNTPQPGVSICMHGQLFDPHSVKKNEKELLFEKI